MLSAMALTLAARALTLYVAPTGVDTNTGLGPNRPLRTLAHAVELTRGHPGATIRLAPGTYPIEQTIRLTAADNGLTLDGGNGRLPHLTGGRSIGGWRLATDTDRLPVGARGYVYVCDLPSTDLGKLSRRGFGLPRQPAAMELFFDSRPMTLAQYPNDRWLRTGKVLTSKSFSFEDSHPKTWKPSEDVWVLGYWTFDWAESYEHVTHLDEGSLTTDEPGGTYGYAPGRRFRFLNVLEELDRPGEYFIDRSAKKIYFWPPEPLAGKSTTVSLLSEPMVALSGASDVTIRNVCLEEGRDGGLMADKAANLHVESCLVRNFGTYGIALNGCKDSSVKRCDLTGLGEFGIALDGGDRMTLTPGNLVAEDDHIWAYSRWTRTYQPGISISGVGNRILGCRIHDAPHEAIALNGNDHQIERNDIRNVCLETGDAGAVYMGRDPTTRGNVIRWNRFTRIGPLVTTHGNFTGVMSVYLDDCWCGTTVEGNIFDTLGTGIMIGGGRDNKVLNNVFLGCHPAIHFDARGKGWAKDMFANSKEWGFHQRYDAVHADQPPYTTRYPQLAIYWQDDPAFPKGNVIARNASFGGKWLTLLDGLTDGDYAGGSNVVGASPLPLPQALKQTPPGFQPIPLAKIGSLSRNRPIERDR